MMGYNRRQGDKVKRRNPFGILKGTGERRGNLTHDDKRRKVLDKFNQRVNRDAEQE